MDKAMHDKGMSIRRKVLGEAYVDAATKNVDDFNRRCRTSSTNTAGARSGAAKGCRSRPAACSTSP